MSFTGINPVSRLLLFVFTIVANAQEPEPLSDDHITGRIERHASFGSEHVDPRNIDIWLPPNYEAGSVRYPVIYMHDGQNLFTPTASSIGVEWGIDETMMTLIEAQRINPAIIVGVWNTPKRVAEYMPEKMMAGVTEENRADIIERGPGLPISNSYLRFIVEELKPFVDGRYRTRPEQPFTYIMGSSMGGLISLYALTEYPGIFAGAGCLSTHWPITDSAATSYLMVNLPDPGTHKIYFDFGTETLDSLYEPFQIKVNGVMMRKGYRGGENWITMKFDGEEHSERAWKKRVYHPIEFFLRKGVRRAAGGRK